MRHVRLPWSVCPYSGSGGVRIWEPILVAGSRWPEHRGDKSSEPMAAGYGETSPGAPAGIAFRSARRAGLMCLLTSRLGDACLLHPGPVAVPHAVRRKPGQYLAASSPRPCVRPGLRRGDGRCGDEMTGACESHSSNGRARRHNRHLTLRRKGSEERAEDFVMSDDAVLRLAGLYRA